MTLKVISRKRVYWFYIIIGIFFLLIFFPYPDANNPYSQAKSIIYNYSFSDNIAGKIVNSPKSIKAAFLYLLLVSFTSFFGYVITNIIKDYSYQKSFLISFIVSTIIGISLFCLLFLIL